MTGHQALLYTFMNTIPDILSSCSSANNKNLLMAIFYIGTPCMYIYRVSQEECDILREGVPYVKIYRYNPKHLCPKLNGYGDNGERKVWSSVCSTHYTYQLTGHIRPMHHDHH
jgi:hypothetical protein